MAEYRYRAVREVLSGSPVGEVALRNRALAAARALADDLLYEGSETAWGWAWLYVLGVGL
jgi:hypothetical protein